MKDSLGTVGAIVSEGVVPLTRQLGILPLLITIFSGNIIRITYNIGAYSRPDKRTKTRKVLKKDIKRKEVYG